MRGEEENAKERDFFKKECKVITKFSSPRLCSQVDAHRWEDWTSYRKLGPSHTSAIDASSP